MEATKNSKEKFIPLGNFILTTRIVEAPNETEIKSASGLFLTSEVDLTPQPTNRLIIKAVGNEVVQKDLIKEGVEVMFNMKGNTLTLNGEEFLLTNEQHLFGVIERV